jgi:hypothetical protein
VALTSALAVASVFAEGGEQTVLSVVAAVLVSLLLVSVLFREVLLRRRRTAFLRARRRLDENISAARARFATDAVPVKVSVERNTEIVGKIDRKSRAARELMHVAAGHLEVFEMCDEYLLFNKVQIEAANPGSPRLGSLMQSRESVRRLHHFHLLAWAELESKALTESAAGCASISDRADGARSALTILETALSYYPQDPNLLDSHAAIKDTVFSLDVSSRIEAARTESERGNFDLARAALRETVGLVSASGMNEEARTVLIRRIEKEIERFGDFHATGN